MFLLNNQANNTLLTSLKFTIQNVPIKLSFQMNFTESFINLQYKMFLLNMDMNEINVLPSIDLQYKMFLLNLHKVHLKHHHF